LLLSSVSLEGQAYCTGNCDTGNAPCYYLTLATSTSTVYQTIEGDNICCAGFIVGGSTNYNCAQMFITVPPGTRGLDLSFDGPNQCSIDLHELQNGCPNSRNNGQSVCDPFCPDMETFCEGEDGATSVTFEFTLCKEGNFNAIDLILTGIPKACLELEDTNEACTTTFIVTEGATWSSNPVSALAYLSCLDCTHPTFEYTGPAITDCNGLDLEYTASVPGTVCEPIVSITKTMTVFPALDGTITSLCEDECQQVLSYNPNIVCSGVGFFLIDNLGDTLSTNTTGVFTVPSDNNDYYISIYRDGTPDCSHVEVYNAAPETVKPEFDNFPVDITLDLDISSEPDTLTTTTGFPDANDNCDLDPAIRYSDDISGLTGCSNTGDILRTFTTTDDCGNTCTQIQIITVQDTTKPVITQCPPDIDEITGCETTGLGDIGGLIFSLTVVEITVEQFNNVGGEYFEVNNVTITYSDWISDNSCPNPLIVVKRTFVITDDCGNSDTCVQTLEFVDYTNPEVTCPPPLLSVDGCDEFDVTAASTGLDYASVETPVSNAEYIALGGTINDLCGFLHITYIDAITPDVCPAAMLYVTRTFIVTDECDNSDTCEQIIEVYDLSGPEFFSNEDVTVSCENIPPDDDPIVTDDCGAVFKIFYSEDTINKTCINDFTLIRTWGYEDICENQSFLIQNIVVTDNTPPTIICPEDLTIMFTMTCIIDTTLGFTGYPIVNETCLGGYVWSYSDDDSGINTYNGHGTIIRTFVASDQCGNSASCDQTITLDGYFCGDGCPTIFTNKFIRYNGDRG